MNLISTFIVWIWLLCISLVVPTSLPAGGYQKSTIHHRKNNIGDQLITMKDCNLLSSACIDSSILTRIQAGSPVSVLKVWESNDSGRWLLVNVKSTNFSQLFHKRGWINIETN